LAGERIAKVDASTGRITVYKTPSANSPPRRGRVDAQNRLWFAEHSGNAIGMFDPKTESACIVSCPRRLLRSTFSATRRQRS
jgi:streptogramin lyase